ncbi:hypothetical protein GCM10010217_43340 [Streptomyces tubercidicus]
MTVFYRCGAGCVLVSWLRVSANRMPAALPGRLARVKEPFCAGQLRPLLTVDRPPCACSPPAARNVDVEFERDGAA